MSTGSSLNRLLALFLGVVVELGCHGVPCRSAAPSLDLEISTQDGALAGEIRSLEVSLVISSVRARRVYDLGSELSDGATSLRVVLDVLSVQDSPADITVRALDAPSGEGRTLASDTKQIALTEDGCNAVHFALERATLGPEGDAGIAVGHPAPDAHSAIDAETAPGATDAEVFDAIATDPIDAGSDQPDVGVGAEGAGGVDAADGGVPGPSGADASVCRTQVDPATISLYSFEEVGSTRIADRTNRHDGRIVGSNPRWINGPGSCGKALQFPSRLAADGGIDTIGVVADSVDFALSEGSIDLWIKDGAPPPHGRELGVFGRDDVLDQIRGISVRIACDGTIVAKLEDGIGGRTYACSNDPLLPSSGWVHVGVNFGPPTFELWVNGALQTRTGTLAFFGPSCTSQTITCASGAAGNGIQDPYRSDWVMGADPHEANSQQGTSLDSPFRSGAIDEVRISGARRTFDY
jgi:hypothetical protein